MPKFTDTFLSKLDRKDAGKTFTDTAYAGSGHGSLIARVAKDGQVSFSVKYQDPSLPGTPTQQQRKEKVNHVHPLLEKHGIRAFLRENTTDELRRLVKAHVTASRGAPADYKPGIESVGREYIAYRLKNETLTPSAARQVELAVERAVLVWGEKPLAQLNQTDATDLIRHILDEHGREAARTARGYLPGVLAYAKRVDPRVNTGLFRKLDIPAKQLAAKPRTGVVTIPELKRLFDAMNELSAMDGIVGERDRPRRTREHLDDKLDNIRLLYLTAARKCEWERAVWEHVGLEAGTWFLPAENRKQKDDDHTFYLPSQAVAVLERIRERRIAQGQPHGPGDPVFPKLYSDAARFNVWADVKKLAGIDFRLTLHDLRACRISHWVYEDGVSEREVAAAVGSKDIKTMVRHYARDSASDERKQARVESKNDAGLAI